MNTKINLLDHGFIRLVDHMGSDLSVVRSARVSYDAAWRAGQNEGSDARLISYLWNNRHTTPFESVTFTFEVKAPIFVFRQWHRHRTFCLSGDSMISFELPCRYKNGTRTAKKLRLDDLYRKWQPSVRKNRPNRQTNALFGRSRVKNMLLRVFDEHNKKFTVGHVKDIIFSGLKDVFEVSLKDGKILKCSKDHKLLTTDGWQRLEDAVGLTVTSSNTVAMTREAYVRTNGFTERHTPWNKGLFGYKTSRVMTSEQKQRIRDARSGVRSNFWKGGMSSDRAKIARWTTEQAPKVHARFDYTCQNCGARSGKLEAHHIEAVVYAPHLAYEFNNLISLCSDCHGTIHGRHGDRAASRGGNYVLRADHSKIVSVRYVGQEPTFDLEVDGPHHNFVANGMIVHNSYNELSARYRELPEEVYMPDFRAQSTDNKQGSDGYISDEDAKQMRIWFQAAYDRSFHAYRMALNAGVAREIARSVLPVATYSTMFCTCNLLNLLKFLTLRDDAHAQYEIRVYAEAMKELIRPIVPVTVATWESAR